MNEDIHLPENTALPAQILEDFIRRASHRVIVDYCACRKALGCKRYPADIGCLMMGSSALEIHPDIRREVSVDEALEHARAAMDKGLVPLVGKVRIDNLVFGIKDKKHLLSTCFCCECCCITRNIRHVPIDKIEPLFPPLEGVSIEVTDECKGCGTCAEHCYIKAITIVDKRAVIGEYCRACGRCATVCPKDAIRVRLDDHDFLEKTIERIRSYVKYD